MRTPSDLPHAPRGHWRRRAVACFLFPLLLWVGAGCEEPTPPGVVISHEPAPSLVDVLLGNDKYIGSPSIAILPGGVYVAIHDIFGDGSTEETSGVTKVFRSTDQGASWSQTTTLEGQFWSTVFVHGGDLYIFGYTCSGEGDIVIRRSTDAGSTWTVPVDDETGLLRTGNYGGTPNRPVVFDGRLWIGQSTRLMSAPVDADLLMAASWTLSNGIPTSGSWLGGRFLFWSEGQVVASAGEGVVLLPKVRGLPYTALLRAAGPATLTFDETNGFVELPGGEKKFGAAYDAVSSRFYVLDNPVLPAHKDDPFLFDNPEMIRNTAAVLSSKDLRHWDVEKIFLYSPNLHYEAFQYLNFEIEGDDLAVVSRTAFNVGGNLPPRGHDSNLMTFHRIPDFRNLSPDHVLVADPEGNSVLRFEETQHLRAPLGAFALGSSFAGAALNEPVDLAQDGDGNVYVREQGGRILRFDAAGNFLDEVASAPVPFQGTTLSVVQPAPGERTWIGADSQDWEEPTNWYYWGRPDTPEETAVFGSAAASETTIGLDRVLTLRGVRFRNAASYTVDGAGGVVLAGDAGSAVLEVALGQHGFRVPVLLGGPADARVEAGSSLVLEGGLDLDGQSLELSGEGLLTLDGAVHLGGGRLVVSGERAVVLGDPAGLTLDGTLELRLPEGVEPGLGDSFDLLDFTPPLGDAFDAVDLPAPPGGLAWDASELYTTGVVQVVPAAD